jgi:RNA polymerase sigma-70 factor (ECF subfamily)
MQATKQATQTTLGVWEVFSQPLRSYIQTRISEPVEAEDILQEVFLKIHRRLHTLRDEEKLPAWLYQIAKNAITDHYRARRSWESVAEMFDIEDKQEETDAELKLAEQMGYYVRACLPEKYAQALMLTDLEGLTQQELAARLDLSMSGAKSRVQRARRLLREAFLRCCYFEFDRRGHIIDYGPRPDACRCDCENAS